MPTNVVMEIIEIIEDLLSTTTTREKAAMELFGLDLATNEYKFAKAIAVLIKKLSRVSLAEESNETELWSRYIDPFLCGIFDESDEDVFFAIDKQNYIGSKKATNLVDLATRHLHHKITRHQMESEHWFWRGKSSTPRL